MIVGETAGETAGETVGEMAGQARRQARQGDRTVVVIGGLANEVTRAAEARGPTTISVTVE